MIVRGNINGEITMESNIEEDMMNIPNGSSTNGIK
jgi:hypothetical protein